MALYKYFKLAALPSSSSVPAETVKEVNQQVRKIKEKGKKRGEYLKILQKDKLTIAKYASEYGVARSVRKFKDKNLKDSSVRDWKRLYEDEIKNKMAIAGKEVVVSYLPTKKVVHRPPLLGEKCDSYLKRANSVNEK